jgi:hypothetical protein
LKHWQLNWIVCVLLQLPQMKHAKFSINFSNSILQICNRMQFRVSCMCFVLYTVMSKAYFLKLPIFIFKIAGLWLNHIGIQNCYGNFTLFWSSLTN